MACLLICLLGYVGWIGKYSELDASLVEILVAQGAVPFVRTNVPQTLMVRVVRQRNNVFDTFCQWPETFNNVFGRTLNPHNRSLTPGGSSGGEGALIGMRGSVLGVGSDSKSCPTTRKRHFYQLLYSWRVSSNISVFQ